MHSEGSAQSCLHLAMPLQNLGSFATTLLYEATDCDKIIYSFLLLQVFTERGEKIARFMSSNPSSEIHREVFYQERTVCFMTLHW